MYGNDLEHLPAELGPFPQLQKLDLAGNQLTELPADLGRLPQLGTLYFYRNLLQSPPPEIIACGTQAVLEYLRGRE